MHGQCMACPMGQDSRYICYVSAGNRMLRKMAYQVLLASLRCGVDDNRCYVAPPAAAFAMLGLAPEPSRAVCGPKDCWTLGEQSICTLKTRRRNHDPGANCAEVVVCFGMFRVDEGADLKLSEISSSLCSGTSSSRENSKRICDRTRPLSCMHWERAQQ
eukprot:1012241-Rhodomonas_salina.1